MMSIEVSKSKVKSGEVEEEGISPELVSKTHLAMQKRDLRTIETKVKNHIKEK
jgi:hypothetical protein